MTKSYQVGVRDDMDRDIAGELCFAFTTIEEVINFINLIEKNDNREMIYEIYSV